MKSGFRSYRLLAFVICLLLYVSCEDDPQDGHFDYLSSSYIDALLIGDTVMAGDIVSVVHVYPPGCNSFERLDCQVMADSCSLEVIYHFKFVGIPCAHGTGLDTTQHVLCFDDTGTFTIVYDRDDSTTVYQSVYVR